ncbi:hypothetical protein N7497_007407 [Penicillium chrysogenum]|nr:hypothetical protein N7497_007407 [Penicillium chrysogenum]
MRKSDEVPTLHDEVIEEGSYSEDAANVRQKFNIPETAMGRRKHFQDEANRKEFEFEPGRISPIIIDFSVRLPGFNLHIMKYVDESNHELRYTLKDISTGRVYLAVVFSVVLGEPEDEKEYRKGEQRDDSLGKFDWEPEPSSNDIE